MQQPQPVTNVHHTLPHGYQHQPYQSIYLRGDTDRIQNEFTYTSSMLPYDIDMRSTKENQEDTNQSTLPENPKTDNKLNLNMKVNVNMSLGSSWGSGMPAEVLVPKPADTEVQSLISKFFVFQHQNGSEENSNKIPFNFDIKTN